MRLYKLFEKKVGHDTKLTAPDNTVVVDTPSDLDWYKLGQHFPTLGNFDPNEFGAGGSDTVITFANKEEADKFRALMARTGVKTRDIGQSKQHPEIHTKNPGVDEAEKLALPDLEVGDEVKVGKFKNRKAEITGFDKDEHNQPVMKTTKGDQKVFKNRHSKLEEAFTSPYPIKMQDTGKGLRGTARTDDGSTLDVKVWINGDIYDLEFERNGSMDLTGGGDQYRIFATVMDAIKQIVDQYHPQTLRFSAEKEDGYSGEETGRAKLYTRMVNKFASSLGYNANIRNARFQTNFTLTSKQPDQVNEITMDHRTKKGDFSKYDLDDFIGLGRKVGNINGYDIWMHKDGDKGVDHEVYWLVQDPEGEGFLGYVLFIYNQRDKFYRSNVFFDPSIQGKALAVKMYAAAIRQSGITVVSDLTQTPGSKALWKKLAHTPGITVYGWDTDKDEYFHWDPDTDEDNEVWQDTKAVADEVALLRKKMVAIHNDYEDGKMSKEDYESLTKQYKDEADDIQAQRQNWRSDIRLVATKA